MREAQDIIKELQGTALTDNQKSLLKELSNTLGGKISQIKEEIIRDIELEAGNRQEMSVSEIKGVIMMAGKEI